LAVRKIKEKMLCGKLGSAVQLEIDDLVEGKCVFQNSFDLIEAVRQIKDFARKDCRFSIKNIKSRYSSDNPSSDVTLKITIGSKIVASL